MSDTYIDKVQVGGTTYNIRDNSLVDNSILTVAGVTGDTLSINSVSTVTSNPDNLYILGVTGLSKANPIVQRTYDNARVSYNTIPIAESVYDDVYRIAINFTGLELDRIWGGYCGHDGETLTWSTTQNNFVTTNNTVYTGDVFSVIKQFFVRPTYTTVDNTTVLESLDLAFTNTSPSAEWQDWFRGKSYVGIGCYPHRSPTGTSTLQSKKGVTPATTTQTNPDLMVQAYKRCSTTNGSLHGLWYNEYSILNVLFMVLFGTRNTAHVFLDIIPARDYDDTLASGYLDEFRTVSNCATGYRRTSYDSSSERYCWGVTFLGIEDFFGHGDEVVFGITDNMVGSVGNYCVSDNYQTFAYATTSVTDTGIQIPMTSGDGIRGMICDPNHPGLLVPILKTANNGIEYNSNAYYCGTLYFNHPIPPLIRTARLFDYAADLPHNYDTPYHVDFTEFSARLCRTPA